MKKHPPGRPDLPMVSGAEPGAAQFVRRMFTNPYVLIAPAMTLLCIFTLYPVVFGFAVSFCKWDIIRGTIRYIGLDNYATIFTNKSFMTALGNSFKYMIVTVFFTVILALLGALFLNRNTWAHNLVQSVAFSPHIISFVSVAMLWKWLMDAKVGILNYILQFFGLPALLWLKDEKTALISIIIVAIWKSFGYAVVIIMAGLQSIPVQVYEAARLDRSRPATTLFRITIPLLSPTLFFLVVTQMIGSFCAFDIVRLMTNGGPQGSSNVLVYYIYQTGFQFFRIGEAQAAATVLMMILALISFLNFKFFSNKIHYQ